MKKISFLSLLWTILLSSVCTRALPQNSQVAAQNGSGVAVLLVDTDLPVGKINLGIYGQFLEHINHSVVDGIFAEQMQGGGFEGKDFDTYWKPFSQNGSVEVVSEKFKNGEKSVKLQVNKGNAGITERRFFLEAGKTYNGSVWARNVEGSPDLFMTVKDSTGKIMIQLPLKGAGREWKEISYSFTVKKTDTQSIVEFEAKGSGVVLLDFISLMRADVRSNGALRPDLFQSLNDLQPSFIRWPGGSYASVYLWKDGIGPRESRVYHPNTIWGGYSDYYGFGTDEFMELCRQLKTEPLVCLPATTTNPEDVKYAIDWVHYLNDPATTEMGKLRASYGHPEPYNVKYFQVDNEPMNHNFSPEQYANIVNVYGSEIRKIDRNLKIVACGQKRSNDLNWSQKVIDIAGDNFDILGCHNYEYENENFQTGLLRIENYLVKLRDYIRNSKHPDITLSILEWGLSRTYDWRNGMHTAGSLIMFEKLGNELQMTCPALLMRNTTDDPTWTAYIYHDHVGWFPGGGYVVAKLFREHYAENHLASTSGVFNDLTNRKQFFDQISQFRPTNWRSGTIDAIATGSEDGKKIVLKAVNYDKNQHTLLTRLQGSKITANADVKIYSVRSEPTGKASLKDPGFYRIEEKTVPFAKDLDYVMDPYSVLLVEITFR
ncbi:MAG TPA: carbohydrate binding domain-containing protein [Bacteroidales bacterium]|nr:carbohydrate binding domain-containing protein [Bacteroidales bacterium]